MEVAMLRLTNIITIIIPRPNIDITHQISDQIFRNYKEIACRTTPHAYNERNQISISNRCLSTYNEWKYRSHTYI